MAMRLVVLYYMVLVVALMCSLVLLIHLKPTNHVSSSDCRVGYGCIPTTSSSTTEIRSRKLLLNTNTNSNSNAEEVFKSFVPVLLDHHHQQGVGGGVHDGGNVNVYWSSLRNAPSGPDPLHHNGSGPGPNKPEDP